MNLPTVVEYPVIAVGDLHGQREELDRLIERLEVLEEWSASALVFLGDFVDRGPDVPGTIDRVLSLLRRPPGGSGVVGNHDLALIRAARLDDGPASSYWTDRYRFNYDCHATFEGYLGRAAMPWGEAWLKDLESLRAAMPREHRDFLASLPWVVEAPGHLFLHCGLSPELGASPAEQLQALKRKRWTRPCLKPVPGTGTDRRWESEYPVWLGADRSLSTSPRAYPGKVQVTGHVRVRTPEADPVRIRLDSSGGTGPLTACLLRAADAEPVFLSTRQ